MAGEQPKKPPSGYWLWLGEAREAIAKEIGNPKGSAVAKAAGEKWRVLPEAKKAPYEKRAAALKAAYDKEMADFKSKGGVPVKRSRKPEKPEKKVKDANAPKKPVGGAYGVFLAAKRDEIKNKLPADHKMTDVAKEAGTMWKALSQAQRKPYEDQYAEKSKAYKQDLEEYKKSGGQAEEGDKEEDEGEGEDAVEGEGDDDGEAATKMPAKDAKDTKAKAKAAPKKRAAEAKQAPASKRSR